MVFIFLIGRIILGVFWLAAAYKHIFQSAGYVAYSQSKGVPAPQFAVIGTGVLALVGGVSILTGLWPWLGIVTTSIFLIGVTFKMHAFWKDTDPQARMNNRINFEKNLAILGATLMFVAISTPWMYSLTW